MNNHTCPEHGLEPCGYSQGYMERTVGPIDHYCNRTTAKKWSEQDQRLSNVIHNQTLGKTDERRIER